MSGVAADSGDTTKEKGKRHAPGGKGGKASRVATPALVIGLLSEKEASNHREAWQAVLLVMTGFKETWKTEKGAAVSARSEDYFGGRLC